MAKFETQSPFKVIKNVRKRNIESILWNTRNKNKGLSRFILSNLGSVNSEDALLKEPIIEAAYSYVKADVKMSDLKADFLDDRFAAILDKHTGHLRYNDRPFLHQYKAWKALSKKEPKSVIVSSGTGSGKTECFMIPLINNLAHKTKTEGKLVGVRAIMLYPLNALIESQKERLDDFTKEFDDKIRFALYTGATADKINKSNNKLPLNELLDRESIRKEPPPILVTNKTMLEYMLLRDNDEDILKQSQGKLEWIILDEAHTHIGSSAAELTFTIRRVLDAFGVEAKNVRFVATSATIGAAKDKSEDGKQLTHSEKKAEIENQLRNFLKDISGAEEAQIEVIIGEQQLPKLPQIRTNGKIQDISSDDSNELWNLLATNSNVQKLVSALCGQKVEGIASVGKSIKFSEFEKIAKEVGWEADEFAEKLSIAAESADNPLAPLRIHAFHSILPGIWSCVNKNCEGRHKQEIDEDWAFGRIYSRMTQICEDCGSVVLEVKTCSDCGEPVLHGQNYKNKDILWQISDKDPNIEWEDDEDKNVSLNEDEEKDQTKGGYIFPAKPSKYNCFPVYYNKSNKHRLENHNKENLKEIIELYTSDYENGCPNCSAIPRKYGPLFKGLGYHSPIIMLNSIPILLEGTPAADENSNILPFEGRQLLTFTDSRQGTARIAEKLERDSERNFMRSYIYQLVQRDCKVKSISESDRKGIEEQIKQNNLEINDTKNEKYKKYLENDNIDLLKNLNGAPDKNIKFKDGVLTELTSEREMGFLAGNIWAKREIEDKIEQVFTDSEGKIDQGKMAEFLLLREFINRPKFANTSETLGLVSIMHPALDAKLAPNEFKETLKQKHFDNIDADKEWQNYLNIFVTHWFRSANAVSSVSPEQRHFMGKNYGMIQINKDGGYGFRKWPDLNSKGNQSVMPKLLAAGLGLDIENETDREQIKILLECAIKNLECEYLRLGSANYSLKLKDIELTRIKKAFLCKRTNRLFDRVFMGLTPYVVDEVLKDKSKKIELSADEIIMPDYEFGFPDDEEGKSKVIDWLTNNEEVKKLRELGVWGPFHDKIAMPRQLFLSMEHSAQLRQEDLKDRVKRFTKHKINVLNCSTTMEMGVDIGSVATVVMSNVPPAISNYRQRAGRAGRRGQNLATAFTVCKDRQFDQEVFRDPQKFMCREVGVPHVYLKSKQIAQRHVNSLLLAKFLREFGSDVASRNNKSFFGYNDEAEKIDKFDAPIDKFIKKLDEEQFRRKYKSNIENLLIGSGLPASSVRFEETKEAALLVKNSFSDKVEKLKNKLNNAKSISDEATRQRAIKAIVIRLGTHVYTKNNKQSRQKNPGLINYNLLSYLLNEEKFLPSSGFPTDVIDLEIPFWLRTKGQAETDKKNKEDSEKNSVENEAKYNQNKYGDNPQRNRDLAISEYAPGQSIFIDGMRYESGGISVSWQVTDAFKINNIANLVKRYNCKNCGNNGVLKSEHEFSNNCSICGEVLDIDDGIIPDGFVAKEIPDSDTDIANAFSKTERKVSLDKTDYRGLVIPTFGRTRISGDAEVIYSNSGPYGYGYEICLLCGCAEAEENEKPKSGEDPSESKLAKGHDKLNGLGKCEIDNSLVTIRRNHILLHSNKTDCFELQPYGLKSREIDDIGTERTPEDGARALASAIREIVAQELGILPTEIGIEVISSKNENSDIVPSIFLFDYASSGAGFSIQAQRIFEEKINDIRNILDCPNKCETGCLDCVVNNEVGRGGNDVDRKIALAWVNEYIKETEIVSKHFGHIAGPVIPIGSVIDDIDQNCDLLSEVNLFVSDYENFDPCVWPDRNLSEILRKWQNKGIKTKLLLSPEVVSNIDKIGAFKLTEFKSSASSEIERVSNLPDFQGLYIIAQSTRKDGKSNAYLSAAENGNFANENFGINTGNSKAPIIKCAERFEIISQTVEMQKIMTALEGYKKKIISNQLDGNISNFGGKFSKIILDFNSELGVDFTQSIVKIRYEDKYLKNPLSVKMLMELIKAIKSKTNSQGMKLEVSTSIPFSINSRPIYNWKSASVTSDWYDFDPNNYEKNYKNFFSEIGNVYGIPSQVQMQRHAKHGRTMELVLNNGKIIEINFDHGFGAWTAERSVVFDFTKDTSLQAKAMKDMNFNVKIKDPYETFFYIGSKN